ncbi:response regulator [Candidatus Peregrinibacteria bacterium]|jgi:DNA-binding response OmpR family regulator|nr:response regulator [Candidatus Peregrinibacteria bacterium]
MKNIFILEDEQVLGSLYKKHLEAAGYKVCWEKYAENVLLILKSFPADILFIDHGIEGKELAGLDIIPNIKKLLPHAKIIVLSNYSKFQLGGKAKSLGADDYLVKLQCTPKKLLVYLKKLIAKEEI